MTIDEAIKHCEEVAEREQCKGFDANTKSNCRTVQGERHYKCAEEHRQLAGWLKLLKQILDSGDCNSCALLHSQCRYAPRLGEQVRYNCPFYCSSGEEGGKE